MLENEPMVDNTEAALSGRSPGRIAIGQSKLKPILDALGINLGRVRRLVLDINVQGIVTAYVEQYPDSDSVDRLVQEFKNDPPGEIVLKKVEHLHIESPEQSAKINFREFT